MTLVLGEMDVARVNPYRFDQGQPPSALGLVPTPPANDGHPFPGEGEGDSSSATYPVDDVHQARLRRALGMGKDI